MNFDFVHDLYHQLASQTIPGIRRVSDTNCNIFTHIIICVYIYL